MRDRLDMRMLTLGLSPSRAKAQRLIMAGAVRINGQVATKPSDTVDEQARIEVIAPERYASRGGYKLEASLQAFAISPHGLVCADLGASTGGFTDCLLQHGALRVHAVDVGCGQLDWNLRQDPRVTVHDNLNARHITRADLGGPVDLVTIDVSFISLKKVLPAAASLVKPGGIIIALVKPQFEAGRAHVKKGGVVKDPSVHQIVKDDIMKFAVEMLEFIVLGVIESPLRGPAGNKEFLIGMRAP